MQVVASVVFLFQLAIILRVVLSWFPGSSRGPVSEILERITEPVLGPIRRILPPLGGLDLSPIIVIIGLNVLLQLLR